MKDTTKEIGLFDIINMMFKDKDTFNSLSDIILRKHYFMINRIFAIKFPMQAVYFSLSHINEASVIRAWQGFIESKDMYGQVPRWIYTKGSKKSSENKEKKNKVPFKLITEYCKHYNVDIKDVSDALLFFEDDMNNELKRFESLINTKNNIEREKNQ